MSDELKDQEQVPVPVLPGEGEGEPQPSEVELRAAHDARVQLFYVETIQAIKAWAPHVPEHTALQLTERVVQEQMQLMPQIFQGMLLPDLFAKFPTFQMQVGMKDGPAVVMESPKRFEGISDPQVAAQAACVVAILHCPQARAILRAYGFEYTFAQSAKAAPGKIILSS